MLDGLLQNVHFPYDIFSQGMSANELYSAIDVFYSDIIHCLKLSCEHCVPF